MKDMTGGTPWKIILKFSLPIMAGNLLQQMYHTADTVIVGNAEGELALSAVGACTSLTELFIAMAIGFSFGAGILVAQCYGAERMDLLRSFASTSILLMTGIGALMSLFGILAGEFLLKNLLYVPENLLELSSVYFRIYCAGLLFQFAYNIFSALLQAIGDSKATLFFLLLSSAVNIVLDLLLVNVFGMGVAGAASATVFSQFCACMAGGIYMYKKYELLRFRKDQLHFDRNLSKETMKTGMPMVLQSSIISIGMILLQKLVNSYGQAMIASFTVVSRLQGWMTIPLNSLQKAMATYSGQNAGAKKKQRISTGLWQAVAMSLGITLCLSGSIYLLMDPIVKLFGVDAEALEICIRQLRVKLPSVMLYAAYFPMNGVFQGVGDGVHATAFSLLALTLRILFSYTLSTMGFWGYSAIWWSETYAWLIVIVVYYTYYLRGNWKNKVLIS